MDHTMQAYLLSGHRVYQMISTDTTDTILAQGIDPGVVVLNL